MLELWYRALASQFGIALASSDTKRLRDRLYAARREAADADLNQISIIVPSEPGQLWLVKMPQNEVPNGPTQGE